MSKTALCTPPGQPAGTMRPSRRARWRALTLVLVHVAFAIHIAHWYRNGTTLTPVEPSEAMQTLGSQALVNAGFLFFVVTIAGTLVFGRFFCGWGCHLVALQDLCTWLLQRIGIRPRPLRSRLLVYVPLLAAIYMFVVPTVTRILLGQPRADFQAHFLTDDFWGRFPGPAIATLTFLVCGFLIVYLLGNKGFCTYACPYGGIFGPADQVAPGAIRVTDACEGCGHCTATCTSNVRVHEEVRQHRMVIDPGCMKCMDCVSVCPRDALYFGFGKPAVVKGAPRARPPRPRYDFSWREELAMSGVFLVAILILRGLYDRVPFLLGLGLASITAFVALLAFRFARRQAVRIGHASLRTGGRVSRAGVVFVAALLLWGAFLAHAGTLRTMVWVGGMRVEAATTGGRTADPAALADGIQLLSFAARQAPVAMPRWDGKAGEALARAGRHQEAEVYFRRAVEHAPRYVAAWDALYRYAAARNEHAAAAAALGHVVELVPARADAWLALATHAQAALDHTVALDAAGRAAALAPDLLDAHRLGALSALELDLVGEAAPFIDAARRLAPDDTKIIELWARHLSLSGRLPAAIDAAERQMPASRRSRAELAFLYQAAGRYDDARRVALELQAESREP